MSTLIHACLGMRVRVCACVCVRVCVCLSLCDCVFPTVLAGWLRLWGRLTAERAEELVNDRFEEALLFQLTAVAMSRDKRQSEAAFERICTEPHRSTGQVVKEDDPWLSSSYLRYTQRYTEGVICQLERRDPLPSLAQFDEVVKECARLSLAAPRD
eukprot:GHVU01189455.1.p1 GENE.GHVU01189455.1~~GHVU01189455.1.p1  ORF type:complete len:156 (+),score=18.21 GHVU01189455.1:783-1250(+)